MLDTYGYKNIEHEEQDDNLNNNVFNELANKGITKNKFSASFSQLSMYKQVKPILKTKAKGWNKQLIESTKNKVIILRFTIWFLNELYYKQ